MTAKIRYTCYSVLTVVTVGMQAFARTIVVPPQPVSPYADTEVSTNMPFVVDGERTREIKMRFALDGCASNCIQVAFGRDADGDGVLGADESETLYGWRNGRYFAEDVKAGVRTEEPEAATGRVLSVRMRMTKESLPAHFAATNGVGVAVLGDIASSVPEWIYRPEWNLMRVTRRGPGVPAECFLCDVKYNEFFLIMR